MLPVIPAPVPTSAPARVPCTSPARHASRSSPAAGEDRQLLPAQHGLEQRQGAAASIGRIGGVVTSTSLISTLAASATPPSAAVPWRDMLHRDREPSPDGLAVVIPLLGRHQESPPPGRHQRLQRGEEGDVGPPAMGSGALVETEGTSSGDAHQLATGSRQHAVLPMGRLQPRPAAVLQQLHQSSASATEPAPRPPDGRDRYRHQ
jgi:hypothetical protein